MQLDGAVVAVTGGARGIGRATAAALERSGASVAVGDLDGGLPLDVTDPASFTAFLDAVEAEHGPLDALVNNAGIMLTGRFTEESPQRAARMVDVNLGGVITGSRLACARFLSRGHGHLVNVASVAGKAGFSGGATYCATKHAVVGLSEALRAELRGTGVEVSVVMPGHVRTELTAGFPERQKLVVVDPEQVAAAIVRALRRPRFEVYVPRRMGPAISLSHLVPRRLREALARAAGADDFLLGGDPAARAAYEARAVGSGHESRRP